MYTEFQILSLKKRLPTFSLPGCPELYSISIFGGKLAHFHEDGHLLFLKAMENEFSERTTWRDFC